MAFILVSNELSLLSTAKQCIKGTSSSVYNDAMQQGWSLYSSVCCVDKTVAAVISLMEGRTQGINETQGVVVPVE